MTESLLLISAFVAAVLLTGGLRRYALARQVMDVPNERSSHRIPTPRGGGVAIVITFLIGLCILAVAGVVDTGAAVGYVGAGLLVAGVGFLDDHASVEIKWRLGTHLCAAAWGLWWIGGLPDVAILGTVIRPGIAGNVLAVLALVWLLNLYNFMDGIDGIAGVEAVTVALGLVVVAWVAAVPGPVSLLAAMLAMSTVGFLAWNFPQARIFLGDSGSGFLGITLGLMALHAAQGSPALLWSAVILLGVFITDATVTLLRRAARPSQVHLAHRSHAYQHAALRLGSHVPVTLAVGAINVLWLLPWAILVATGMVSGAAGLAGSLSPLVIVTLWLRAGHEHADRHEQAQHQPVEHDAAPTISH